MLAGGDARETISYQNLLVGFLIKCYHVSLSSFMRLMGSHRVSSATNGQKHPVSKSNYYEFIHLEIPLFQKVKNKNGLMSCVEHYHLKLKGLVVLLCKISCTTRWCSKLMQPLFIGQRIKVAAKKKYYKLTLQLLRYHIQYKRFCEFLRLLHHQCDDTTPLKNLNNKLHNMFLSNKL